MPAYLIARVRIYDPEAYQAYVAQSSQAVARYGGRFLVRGQAPIVLEGSDEGLRHVVVEFPDREAALRFYHSPEYEAARKLRAPPVAEGTFLLFEVPSS